MDPANMQNLNCLRFDHFLQTLTSTSIVKVDLLLVESWEVLP